MKTQLIMSALIASAALTACNGDNETIIERPSVDLSGGVMTSEILEALGSVAEPTVSPDGKTVAFTISYSSIEENKSNAEIYRMNIDGTELKRLTTTPRSEANVRWIDNDHLAYIGYDNETENMQIFTMNADGGSQKVISSLENGVDCFELSPDCTKVIIGSRIDADDRDPKLFEGLPKTTGRLVDDLMYKHWDEWVTKIPHPFLADFSIGKVDNVIDIMEGEPYECPMLPMSGAESFAWTPDSKQLVYVSRKLTGMEYAKSTDSNLYLYDLASKKTTLLTEGMRGYDTDPVFSPDGNTLAWLSMETPGYESDKKRLMVMDMKSGEKRDLTENWDWWPEGIRWSPDGKSIIFNGYYMGTMPVFRVNVADCNIETLAEGVWDYVDVNPLADGNVLAMRHSMIRPNEICMIAGGEAKDITDVNGEILGKLKMPTVEKQLVPTTDGKEMTVWVVLPPEFDAQKQYPALLYCQGGPQQAVSQFWSKRWNFTLMASNGYIVICPNRRGVPGFGTEWNAQISGDYGGQNMQDYLAATDFMAEKEYVDKDHIGAIGASYGGFSVYWLAGHHDGRFAALIAHAGMFNLESQYLETEEMWFVNYDLGGAFWEKDNATAQRTYATSPHLSVDKWTAPILVTVGELDYRILASQGMQAFNAAKLRGLEAEMLVFPDENHWILKPQNAILWQRVFFNFLDKYLKTDNKDSKE